MKRSFERDRELPRFRCAPPALESFVEDVRDAFRDGEPRFSITVELNGETAEFEAFGELRAATFLPTEVRRFSLHVSDWSRDRHRSFRLWARGAGNPKASAEGDSDAWCAGLVELSRAFASRHRVWYSFIPPWLFGFLLAAFGTVPWIASSLFGTEILSSWSRAVAFLIAWGLLLYLWISSSRIFPSAVLVLQPEEKWIKRYSVEITVIAAAISAVAAILALLGD